MKIFTCFLACVLYTGIAVEAYNVNLATDQSSGVSIAAWEENTNIDVEIHARIQDALGAWSVDYVISDPLVNVNGRLPQPAINASGQMIVVWIGIDAITGFQGLYGSMFTSPSGPWTAPQQITDNILGDNFVAQITSSGATKVVWTSYNYISSIIETKARTSLTFGVWGSVNTL